MTIKKNRTEQLNFRLGALKFEKLKFLVESSGKSFADYMNELIDTHLEEKGMVFISEFGTFTKEDWEDL